MSLDAWLPIGFNMPDGEKSRRVLYEGANWQIYDTQAGGRILVVKSNLSIKWLDSGLLKAEQLQSFKFGEESFDEISSGIEYALEPLDSFNSPNNKNEALSFAHSFRATRVIDQTTPLQDAIYFEKLSRLLPTYSLTPRIDDDVIFGSWLAGGVSVSVKSYRRLRALTSWLETEKLSEVVTLGGFSVSEKTIGKEKSAPSKLNEDDIDNLDISSPRKGFLLAGRPELESFFNEHIIDIIENDGRYKLMGIEFPSAVILHGPPGCGKTFAVERLIEYLGWPSYQIEASSVASPYIHETSKKVAEVFENAMKNSPSVLVIDEMEAFLADRESGAGSSHHRVEEVAEFLRRIPEAIKNHVLIIAMTNRIDMIDSAILRRGRFDHVIKVDMASELEVRSLLVKLISELPCDSTVDIEVLAKKLIGRPLSDVTFAVREGARLAARSGGLVINQTYLLQAMVDTPSRESSRSSSRKIGFV